MEPINRRSAGVVVVRQMADGMAHAAAALLQLLGLSQGPHRSRRRAARRCDPRNGRGGRAGRSRIPLGA
ncbi:MAG: hypothetical protein MZW92_05490 [Comamonadaceae bacterium]|nr:hypothetical protein [Comamonadaceae bacterium]